MFFTGLVGVAVTFACGDSTSVTVPVTQDAGAEPPADARIAICPKTAPTAGTTCNQPEGTTCAFGVCDGVYAVCTGGVWRPTPTTPVPSGCPEGVPSAGSACPVCFSADASCLYLQACAMDASAVRASCVASAWQLVDDTCVVEAGAGDAAGDAAGHAVGDAGTDADAAD